MPIPKPSLPESDAFIQAVISDNAEVARRLLADATDPLLLAQTPCSLGEAPIFHALKNNCPSTLGALLDAGASHSCRDLSGFSPLHVACSLALDECAELLILAGADLHAEASDGLLATGHALLSTSATCLAMLLMAGAEPADPLSSRSDRFSAILTSLYASLWTSSPDGQQFAAALERRDLALSIEASGRRPLGPALRI